MFKRAPSRTCRPTVEVKSRRIGGSTYQVPLEVAQERRGTLAIRWIVGERPRPQREDDDRPPRGELLDSPTGRGGAVKKKDDVHRMAEANKAFAHYSGKQAVNSNW
jgi:small subunit ribosomal protein S7